MEMLTNAVLADLVSRSVSFLFAKCERQTTTAVQEEDLQRLRQLLLRSSTIVEEGERRHVANRCVLRQLKALSDETFRGNYLLDAARYWAAAAPSGGERRHKDAGGEEVNRRAFALSRFNPAKRLRFPSVDPEAAAVAGGGASSRELQQMVRSLETMIGDMNEFAVLFMSYPPLYQQPYSAHLFVDKCMFGRHMERERVVEFLLETEPPGTGKNLGVLPIVGPALIGKSTLVEHVCNDERVRNHFSFILFYSGNGLKDETVPSFRDNCVIKHRNEEVSGEERLLIVIELSEDVDEETWKRLYSYEKSMAQGSKMVITSRSEKIASFGTTQALRLKCLSTEAYWYFFKMLVFGSDDPGQHPNLASIAMEMARQMQGSFMFAYIGAALLRADFSIQSWSRVLTRLKEYLQKNVSLLGEEYPDDLKAKDRPQCTWSIAKQKPDKYFMLHDIYQRGSSQEKVPKITMIDLLFECAQPRGKYEVLFWKSRIPPYFNYVCTCETVICEH